MLDIRFVRENPERVAEAAKQKGYNVDVPELIKADDERRELQQKSDELRAIRNELAASMQGGKPDPETIEKGKALKTDLAVIEDHLRVATEKQNDMLKTVPNMPDPDVPLGASEDENVVTKTVGEPPKFDFEPKNHAQIAEAKGWLDKERAAKVTGARFAYVTGDLVLLQWALMRFAIDTLTSEETLKKIAADAGLNVSSKPFLPVLPPLMLRTEVFDAMDRLEPRDDRYKLENDELWLQGSAEHVLGPMHMNEIIDERDLPIRYVGYATSFRREAGTYGKDMEGIFRMHQFDKCEMESLTTKENSRDEHFFMIAIQEHLMQQLGLPYHVLNKCTADIGKPNARGVDIEAWLPSQRKYRETHTADYMTDYQTRRLQTRVRRIADNSVELLHTNDATVFSQRPLIAIIENYQTAEGNVAVPEVLRPYLGSRDRL